MATDTLTRLRVLRASGYRCGFRESSDAPRCGAPASLVAHPSPSPLAPSIAVCKDHAKGY
jgi:hypothetical protein